MAMLGIAFLDEPHAGVGLTRHKRSHCAFMGRALAGEPVQIERGSVSCPWPATTSASTRATSTALWTS